MDISEEILNLLNEQWPLSAEQIQTQLQEPDPDVVTSTLRNLEKQGSLTFAWMPSGQASPKDRLLAEIKGRLSSPHGLPDARMAREARGRAEIFLNAATSGDIPIEGFEEPYSLEEVELESDYPKEVPRATTA